MRKTPWVAGLSALALAAAGALTISGPAVADGGPEITKQAGFPVSDLIIFDAKNAEITTQSGSTQTIPSGCSVSVDGDILSIESISDATRNYLGFDGEGLGVGEKRDGGSGCFGADLSFGQGFEITFGDRLIDSVNLDMEFKGDPGLEAVGYLSGQEVTVSVGGDPRDDNDNGPDCSGCDHYRVTLQPASPIDTLVLKPVAVEGVTNTSTASIALSGGFTDPVKVGDYEGSASVFSVVATDGNLACGQTVTDDTEVEITRLALAGCEALQPYLIERDEDGVLIALPNSVSDSYVVTIPWEPEDVNYGTNGPGRSPWELDAKTTFNYLLVDSNGDPLPDTYPNEQDLQFCTGEVDDTSADPAVRFLGLTVPFDVLPGESYPGQQGACGIERKISLEEGFGFDNVTTPVDDDQVDLDKDKVVVRDTVLIVGDPRSKRFL